MSIGPQDDRVVSPGPSHLLFIALSGDHHGSMRPLFFTAGFLRQQECRQPSETEDADTKIAGKFSNLA